MNEEENIQINTIITCLHGEKPVYMLPAGENRSFALCKICYSLIYQDIVKEVLASMAQGMINKAI